MYRSLRSASLNAPLQYHIVYGESCVFVLQVKWLHVEGPMKGATVFHPGITKSVTRIVSLLLHVVEQNVFLLLIYVLRTT